MASQIEIQISHMHLHQTHFQKLANKLVLVTSPISL